MYYKQYIIQAIFRDGILGGGPDDPFQMNSVPCILSCTRLHYIIILHPTKKIKYKRVHELGYSKHTIRHVLLSIINYTAQPM